MFKIASLIYVVFDVIVIINYLFIIIIIIFHLVLFFLNIYVKKNLENPSYHLSSLRRIVVKRAQSISECRLCLKYVERSKHSCHVLKFVGRSKHSCHVYQLFLSCVSTDISLCVFFHVCIDCCFVFFNFVFKR